MDAADREALRRLRDELGAATVSGLAREAAYKAVDLSAAAANGVENGDRIRCLAKAVHAGNVLGARTLIEVGDLRKSHAAETTDKPEPDALWERILIRVRPIAWPIAAVGATGQLPSIIEAIKNLLAK